MSNITPFVFEKNAVRLVEMDGQSCFVGVDVCKALGYKNPTDAMNDHCRGVAKRYPIVDSLGRKQEARVLLESDVLRLIISSSLPAAQRFEAWVFEVVLPSVRKTGMYVAANDLHALPPEMASQVGGIIKAVVSKQLAALLQVELPRLLQAELSMQRTSVRYGKTAGQIWAFYGLPVLKNGSQMLSRILDQQGCSIGKAEMGGLPSKMFDPDKVDKQMKLWLLDHCKKYYEGRKGQGSLFRFQCKNNSIRSGSRV